MPQTELAPNSSKPYHIIKRTVDVVACAIGLLLLSPLLLIVALAIKIEDRAGTVLYVQPRTGKDGVTFKCLKFRSMYKDADARKAQLMAQNEMDGPVFKMKDDPRVTRVGKFIRAASIDELPQLINVIKGDISLVGPRPLPVAEEMACTPYQRQRELVKPGITCLWQISGRSDVTFEQWIEMDLQYIREQSLMTDLKILLRTVPAVLLRKGAY